MGPARHPSRRPRWLRFAAAAAVCFLLLSVLLLAVLWLRHEPAYDGPLEALLPAAPSASLTVTNLSGILETLERSRAYAEIKDSVDLAALLLTDEDWGEFARDPNSAKIQAKLRIGRAFLRRYFGREIVMAFAPSPASPARPGFLGMTRVDVGFLEETAQLVAAFYPDLRLKTSKYRGVTIYLYETKKARRSFSFIRLGQTAALSLRTPDLSYLREVIDRYWEQRALRQEPSGQGARAVTTQTREKPSGAVARFSPLDAYRAWKTIYPQKEKDEDAPIAAAQRAFMESEWAKIKSLDVRLDVGGLVSLQARATFAPGAIAEADALAPAARLHSSPAGAFPADTALLVSLWRPDPMAGFQRVMDIVDQWPSAQPKNKDEAKKAEKEHKRREKRARSLDEWWAATQEALGMDFAADVLPRLGDEYCLALLGAKPGLLAPQPQVRFAASLAPSPQPASGTSNGKPHRVFTLVGPLETQTRDDLFCASLGEDTPRVCAAVASGAQPSLAQCGEWRRLGLDDEARRASALVYANFHALRAVLQAVVDSSALWDEDTRHDLMVWRNIMGALSALKAAGLAATRDSDSLTVTLRFPLD